MYTDIYTYIYICVNICAQPGSVLEIFRAHRYFYYMDALLAAESCTFYV